MTSTNSPEGLKRVIGVPALTLAITGGVIGAGIFALPGIVSNALGGFGVFAYLACSVLFASIMLCYAEIGSRVTTSGGSYAYVEAAFGDFVGYVINWMYFFGWSILGSAALLNIVVDSLAVAFPLVGQPFPRVALLCGMVLFMILINVTGARQSVWFVKIATIIKLLPLIGIILFGFQHVEAAKLKWDHVPSIKTFADTTLILFFAFSGFETSLGASGEIRNPRRTVPLSIFIGGIIVLVMYMLLQTVVQGTLGSSVSTYKGAPLAAVAAQIVGAAGGTILLLCAALSSFANVTLDILCTPRSLFAGANDGLFPKFLGKVHPKFATPYLAVLIYGLAILAFSIAGEFKQLAVLANAIILLIYLAVILATVKLRMDRPDRKESFFRAPGGWVTPAVGMAAIGWLLTRLNKLEILSTVIFIATVSLFYLISKGIRRKEKVMAG